MEDRPTKKPSRRDLAPLGAAALAAIAAAPGAVHAAQAPVRVTVQDHFDILDLFARYSWCYDCSDAEGYGALFTEDGVIDAFGSEAARGRAAIVPFIRTLFAQRGADVWQHRADHLVFFGRPRAYTIYSYWSILRGNTERQEYGVMGLGYYVSECVKQDGRWLFKKRSIFRWNSSHLPWADAP